jgi:hypothetical protein
MNCEWTEKISLLIDGELPRDEAGAAELHLSGCVVCRQAHEDFLHLRAQISAYRTDLDPRVQRAALAEILATAASEKTGSRRSVAAPRRAGFGERVAALFGTRANVKAWAAACVLLFACVVFGLLWRDARPTASHTIADSQKPAADSSASDEVRVPQTEHGTANMAGARETTGELETTPRRRASAQKARVRFETASAVSGATRRELRARTRSEAQTAAQSEAQAEGMLAGVVLPPRRVDEEAARAESRTGREFHIDSPLAATRHVEQAQLLLRSFRNVRLAGARGASDIAEERRRSQKLLYRNIVLRREAATKGDLPVERVLSSLEPILIDIANLPDRPEGDEVLAIRERMQRKNIVAMLQVSATADR